MLTTKPLHISTMARLSRFGFLAIAVAFHLIYAWSVFDVYFCSPLVHGMREYSVESAEPPAKRLMLFVGTAESTIWSF